jgi:murein DD-endopeptidase MepM/ murein hydrolase activator NlpD
MSNARRPLAAGVVGLLLVIPLDGAIGAVGGVRVDPPAVPVGGLAVVRSDARRATGRFEGAPLRFFPVPGGSAALIGVDLEHRSGRFSIEVRGDDGRRTRLELLVLEREFPEERLTVPEGYVEPDARSLRRIARDQRLLAALWRRSADRRYWWGEFTAPSEGAAGSPFGLRRVFNGEPRSPHAGIDFRAPQGTVVRAANRGRVVLAEELFFTGNTVVLDHGLGLFTLYVHLSELEARRGALVDKGEEIGKVGMTGRATGPHLHFAARIGEARIDPEGLLGQTFDGAGARGRQQ